MRSDELCPQYDFQVCYLQRIIVGNFQQRPFLIVIEVTLIYRLPSSVDMISLYLYSHVITRSRLITETISNFTHLRHIL